MGEDDWPQPNEPPAWTTPDPVFDVGCCQFDDESRGLDMLLAGEDGAIITSFPAAPCCAMPFDLEDDVPCQFGGY